MKKFSLIDFLRGWSIFTIVLMHLVEGVAVGVFSKAASFGGAGVHVFILCSGFGLYFSYLRKPLGYIDFLKRRFGRVWTPYALIILLWGVWVLAKTGILPIREIASHLLLYKMFSLELDTSLCYPYWFISTIIQFYLAWPLIVRLVRCRGGYFYSFGISIAWSTLVGAIGYEEMRPWGSFFLQYLWEFCLGMWIAERCIRVDGKANQLMDIAFYKWWFLFIGAIGGMGLSAVMAWNGGVLKLYNDIPSLIGYLFVALLIFKLNVGFINRFFEWANGFSYELYLVHILVFSVVAYVFASKLPIAFVLVLSFVIAYIVAYGYKLLTQKLNMVK